VSRRWKRVAELSSWRQISLGAWDRPRDPTVYGWLDLDVSRALAHLEELSRSSGVKVTMTHLVGKAVALAIARCPEVNAIVRRGRQVMLRESIDVFFQVAYDGGGNLSGAKVREADRKSLQEIAGELAGRAAAIRGGGDHALRRSDASLSRVPALLRRHALRAVETAVYDWGLDLTRFGIPADAFGSAMVTNVGMFGLPHGLAPLVPFSRVPIVLTIGAVHDAPVADGARVVVRPVLSVGVTLDHRLLDGFQAGQLAQRFREVILDPAAAL
jgi:pyruvate/2-oxoglutarate dehydrogenase complex dihydrolipoamide acyltransferase (E2) component